MNRVTKSAICKTITAIRAAREYQKILKELNINNGEPSAITIVFTGHSMKVGGSGPVFDEFTETGMIEWPKEYDVVRFDANIYIWKKASPGWYKLNFFFI